jgi:hypothetical protein
VEPLAADDERWADRDPALVLLHLTEQTARHNGHLDILREIADGVTGM